MNKDNLKLNTEVNLVDISTEIKHSKTLLLKKLEKAAAEFKKLEGHEYTFFQNSYELCLNVPQRQLYFMISDISLELRYIDEIVYKINLIIKYSKKIIIDYETLKEIDYFCHEVRNKWD